ncbi:MAG: GHKL domain-containing protein [Lactobacillales bacterium]|jgi:hypothetical protein|nr:GHKL domain-containing protein [Lactobacillales bacterium]
MFDYLTREYLGWDIYLFQKITCHTLLFILEIYLVKYFFSKKNIAKKTIFIDYSYNILMIISFIGLNILFLHYQVIQFYFNVIIIPIMIILSIFRKQLIITRVSFWIFSLSVSFLISHILAMIAGNMIFEYPSMSLNSIPINFKSLLEFVIAATLDILFIRKLKIIFNQKIETTNKINLFSLLPLIIVSSITFFFMLVFMREYTIENSISNKFGLMAICIFLSIHLCVLVLYRSFKTYFEKNAQSTVQNNSFKAELKYYENVKKAQLEMKHIRHDLRNHQILLLGMLENDEITEAKNYLHQSLNSLARAGHFYTHNFLLNYLLNEKNKNAENFGITLNVKVLLPEKLIIENDVLAIVIGNLLDNAINAVQRNTSSNKKEILVSIKSFNNNILIEVSNSFDLQEIETRKVQKLKGIGIKSIQKIVNEYGGIYKQWMEEDTYITTIALLKIYNK